MTNFEACAVLYNLRHQIEGKMDYETKSLKEDPNQQYADIRKQEIEKHRKEIAALDKAGAALTKRG